MDEAKLAQARDYALTGGGSGYITRHGRLVLAWGDPRTRYDLKSTAKSFGSIALGLAIKDGKCQLDDKAKRHHPTLGVPPKKDTQTGWLDEVTILHLASQSAGFFKSCGRLHQAAVPPGHAMGLQRFRAELAGRVHHAGLPPAIWTSGCSSEVFTPLGIQRSDLTWRKNSYRPATIERRGEEPDRRRGCTPM